ncbi:MAG: CCA tRNA nucleotidyltransferase [Pseudomonadota bacterium]
MSEALRLTPEAAPWLGDPEIQAVLAALSAGGATPRFVGGCVRNAILASGPTDVDVAIDAPPEETVRLLEAAGLRAIPTGIEHGTVTTLAGSEPLEVTSLRRDVETDGRRAVVAFTTDWAEDARRRDFTINALYADRTGAVFDPLGSGVADLRARHVRFIGRAEERIREDYLRILRFYRFAAWYGDAAPEAADLAAIETLRDGIAQLARERVGHEMRKLLSAPRPARALSAMAAAGVLARVLPEADAEPLAALEQLEAALDAAPAAARRLAALMRAAAGSDPDGVAEQAAEALRLSIAETRDLRARLAANAARPEEAGYRFGAAAAADALLIAAAARDPAVEADLLRSPLAAARRGATRSRPVEAPDLLALGFTPGPALGAALRAAEQAWIDSDFSLDKAALLEQARKKVREAD